MYYPVRASTIVMAILVESTSPHHHHTPPLTMDRIRPLPRESPPSSPPMTNQMSGKRRLPAAFRNSCSDDDQENYYQDQYGNRTSLDLPTNNSPPNRPPCRPPTQLSLELTEPKLPPQNTRVRSTNHTAEQNAIIKKLFERGMTNGKRGTEELRQQAVKETGLSREQIQVSLCNDLLSYG